jgi:NDP-sugar pyrophosphorylase family protein
MPVQKPTFAIIPAATSQKSLGRLTSYGRHVPYGPSPASVLPVCNVPNLNRHVMQGVKAGLTDFHVVEHYMTGHIINVMSYGERFSQGQDVEVRVHHLVNREPLDTAQAMRAVIEEQDFPREQCFFVIGSNIAFSEINLKGMVDGFIAAKQTHKSLVGSLGFVLRPASAVINRYGTAILDENNLIEKFIEKTRSNEEVEEIIEKI